MAALYSCTGSKLTEPILTKLEESIDENRPERLNTILTDYGVRASNINRKHLLHKATWLGNADCVSVLLAHGADPNWPHKKIGCPPLHLAHLCTIDNTNPMKTVAALLKAGANINFRGSDKCKKCALDHAIGYQRFDAVKTLVEFDTHINLNSVLTAIDVASPEILEMLLISGGQCGGKMHKTHFWGKVLDRVICTPLKCPKVWYTTTFKLVTESTVCLPTFLTPLDASFDNHNVEMRAKTMSKQHSIIENELHTIAKEHTELAIYLLGFLVRNGYKPCVSILNYASSVKDVEWITEYMSSPPSLKDLTVRVLRTFLNSSGNILCGTAKLSAPTRIRDIISFRTEK